MSGYQPDIKGIIDGYHEKIDQIFQINNSQISARITKYLLNILSKY